jgi:hypothetical protein
MTSTINERRRQTELDIATARLHALAAEATNAAWRGTPIAIIWDFQLA